MNYTLHTGNCLDVMRKIDDNTIDSCITDPPYGMGMEEWDYDVPSVDIWKEVKRILKPGAFCLSFCSPQLYHRMASAVDDAGFDIKDQMMWMVTTKMPKKNRLKQAHEPIVVAQKPFKGSIKANVEKWGVGCIDIDNNRVPWDGEPPKGWVKNGLARRTFGKQGKTTGTQKEFGKVDANPAGRYPSNIIGEVMTEHQKYFYAPRVTRKERGEYNDHPTPKPISLMAYLTRVYCPPGKIVLDPFSGSGSTGLGALNEGRQYLGIDMSQHYNDVAEKRIINHLSVRSSVG